MPTSHATTLTTRLRRDGSWNGSTADGSAAETSVIVVGVGPSRVCVRPLERCSFRTIPLVSGTCKSRSSGKRLLHPDRTMDSGRRLCQRVPSMSTSQGANGGAAPARAGVVLGSLILVAAVANLNLAVANVALPSIAEAFDSSQTMLNLIAVGYSLGLAASVLYFGALGDRYGRKMMLVLGMALSIPACLLAAYAPSDVVLFIARVIGGLSAGMAYPTTLALITALWSGQPRTHSIALWSAIGGATAALGPVTAGALLESFWWGSVFLVTIPLALIALVMAIRLVPAHVNEETEPVDNLGGVLSVLMVGGLILAINFPPVPNEGKLVAILGGIAVLA